MAELDPPLNPRALQGLSARLARAATRMALPASLRRMLLS
jgi:hypothetical protein